ncbi:hypothetical protein [Bacillus sp. AFS017336]|uniref:hypothetical protein n=1 Tax=Bacillus sp. AFS017336 TaxID=2033489 RepID=UPI000BF0FAD5|nr:hypothetical protein [Bacillus sp. AFS017336]PEL13690.1 hypothetical protein CN601_02965 [Bacillus sp. AFS017336]
MKKKNLMILSSLTIGGALLGGTVFANASQVSGYEAYKEAVIQTKQLTNETVTLHVAVKDNGTQLFNASTNIKQNQKENASSSTKTVTVGTKSVTIDSYNQGGKEITKSSSSNQYLVHENEFEKFKDHHDQLNPQIQKSVGVIIDSLVGNMKDNVTANQDGSKLTIAMDKNQVTPLVNAFASIALTKAGESHHEMDNNKEYNKDEQFTDVENFKNLIPQLQSDITINSVKSNVDLNQNKIINHQDAVIVINGTDAKGKAHSIEINVNLDLSNINKTTPDNINLSGKKVKVITSHFKEDHRE